MSGGEADSIQRYETIVIVGGGCYGGYYVRQLHRAARARALEARSLIVVDHDASCAVARALRDDGDAPPIETAVVVSDWREFFRAYLTRVADTPGMGERDAIVPSPLMPHLMADWIIERARARWPDRRVETLPVDSPLAVPWQRAGADGTYYVSFAEWTCPINCIEPRTCPHTRGPRDWSIPEALRTAMSAGADLKGPVIFHCTHRAYGVGMIDTADVVEADRFIAAEGAAGADVLIGTASHCHGALNVLSIPG
jgi:hypothetical protein